MKETLHSIFIWLLAAFFFGMAVGGFGIYKFNDWQMNQSKRLGGLIYQNQIYNLTIRP